MAVDGNSLLHRAHHAHEHSGQRDLDGRPVWALRGLVVSVGGAAARLTPDAVVVAFDCSGDPCRKSDYPAYKAGRREKSPELLDQLAAAPDLLRAAGFAVVQHEDWEADDVLASAAAASRRAGWRCALVTSDRDAFALVDETTSVLRVIAGGIDASPLLTAARLPAAAGVAAGRYRDYAAVRGDVSDNLPGAPGIGPKTAARLMAAFSSVADAFAAIDEGREDVVAAIGLTAARRLADPVARANVERNLALMTMNDGLDLPSLEQMRVPMDVARLQNALRRRDIRLGPSLWALTGAPPPGTSSWDRIAEFEDLPHSYQHGRRVPRPAAAPAPAPTSTPTDDQLSLF